MSSLRKSPEQSRATKPQSRAANFNPDPIKQAAIRAAILDTMRSNPALAGYKVAALHNVHPSTVTRLKAALEATSDNLPPVSRAGEAPAIASMDRGERWGRLLHRKIPLKLRVNVLHKLLTSENPVSAGRALEIVLESDGLRKKIAAPSTNTSIIVQSTDDLGF